MRRLLLPVLVLVSSATACSGASTTSADCQSGLTFRGADYVGTSVWSVAERRAGTASLARCEDTHPDSRGLVFTDDGRETTVWTVPGVPREDAVAVRSRGTGWVYVAVDLRADERRSLLRRVRASARGGDA